MEQNTQQTEQEVVNGYMRDTDGRWILTEEAKQESLRMYYSGRLAYDSTDRRHAIGRYNEHGEVIKFKTNHDN